MRNQFEAGRFEVMDVARVRIDGHAFGHNNHGDLDVWTTTGETGTAFVRQISVDGHRAPSSQGVYSRACVFLRELTTGKLFFLERDDRGFTLQSSDFFGAEAFLGPEAAKVDSWLADRAAARAAVPAGGDA